MRVEVILGSGAVQLIAVELHVGVAVHLVQALYHLVYHPGERGARPIKTLQPGFTMNDDAKHYIASLTPHPLTALYDRLTRKLEQGRAIHLSNDELDWLVVSGGYAKVVEAAAEEQFERARLRIEARGGDLGILGRTAEGSNGDSETLKGRRHRR